VGHSNSKEENPMTKLEQIIQQFRSEFGTEFISTEVVGLDGISICGSSQDLNFNTNDAAARFAEVMKLALKISKKLEIGKLDENLVTSDKGYIISRFLGDGSYYWMVAMTSNATLGTIRMLMNEYSGQIWDAIPHDLNPIRTETPEEAPKEEKSKGEKAKPNKSQDDLGETTRHIFRFP